MLPLRYLSRMIPKTILASKIKRPTFQQYVIFDKVIILELTVLSVDNPGSFYVRIHSPKRLLVDNGDLTNSLSKFTERLTNFCKRFEDDKALKIGDHDLSLGM